MEAAVRQSMRCASVMVACALIGSLLLPAAAVFQLGIIVVATVMAVGFSLAAIIAITGRSLW